MNRFRLSLLAVLLAPQANALDTAPSACTTVRISTSSSGARASGASRLSSVSPDATWVAFESTAADATFGAQPGDPLLSVVGLVPAAGGTQLYQAWYRDTASFCTAATFNLTNAYRIDWAP